MKIQLAAAAIAATLILSACGAAATPTTAPTTAPAAAPAATTQSAQASKKVDANKASIAEIQAALEANGVQNAARWAREVDEYRPYPTNDPNLAKLRQNLAKYNPSADTVDKIVASLSL